MKPAQNDSCRPALAASEKDVPHLRWLLECARETRVAALDRNTATAMGEVWVRVTGGEMAACFIPLQQNRRELRAGA